MIKTLTRTGNSLALVLDRSLLQATGIDADTKVEERELERISAYFAAPRFAKLLRWSSEPRPPGAASTS